MKRSGVLSQDYVTFTVKPSTSVLGQGSVVEFIAAISNTIKLPFWMDIVVLVGSLEFIF